jgi:hypothetical protein
MRWRYTVALGASALIAGLLPVAGGIFGWHSTQGIWAEVINFPGIVTDAWLAYFAHHGEFGALDYLAVMLTNWGFYSLLIWAMTKLRRAPVGESKLKVRK